MQDVNGSPAHVASEGSETASTLPQRWRERLAPRDGPWWVRWWLPLTAGAVAGLIAAILLLTVAFFYATAEIPPPDELAVPEPTVVLSVHGSDVGTLDPAAIAANVALEDVPDHLVGAILAAEDREFFNHRGVSVRAMVRAAIRNLRALGIVEGGSTITQQYADLTLVSSDGRLVRKLEEIGVALRLEQHVDKERILELYLNSVPLGRTAIGVEAAAQTYFSAPTYELDTNEAATLAGMIAAPTHFDPEQNPEGADMRRAWVLEGMAAEERITEEESAELVAAGLPELDTTHPIAYGRASYYIDAVRREIEQHLGDDADLEVGLRVITEMDARMQVAAQETLTANLAGTPYSGAIVSVDPRDGGVRVLVGGPDFEEQPFNTAIQSLRQPGSAFKTFGLGAFLEAGYSPQSIFPAPSEMEVDFEGHPSYEVSNYQGAGFGRQTVREATVTSTNVVFVQMAAEIGPDAVKDFATAAGIPDHDEFDALPSLVIGTEGVTPLAMSSAYATIAAEGVYHEPRLIRRIEDAISGEVLFEAEIENEERLDAEVTRQITDILEDVIQRGTGTAAALPRPVAGKTGTSDDFRDAWFSGYVPQLATSVWIGNLDHSPMPGVAGGGIPTQTWAEFMREALDGIDVEEFPPADFSGLQSLDRIPDPDPTPTPMPDEPTPTPDEPTPTPDEPTPTPDEPTPTPDEPDPTPTPPDDDNDDDDNDDE